MLVKENLDRKKGELLSVVEQISQLLVHRRVANAASGCKIETDQVWFSID